MQSNLQQTKSNHFLTLSNQSMQKLPCAIILCVFMSYPYYVHLRSVWSSALVKQPHYASTSAGGVTKCQLPSAWETANQLN